MRFSYLIMAFLGTAFVSAQTGNEITTAISVDGTILDINVLSTGTTTTSGLTPACGSDEDVFYKHTPSASDNKVTIGMISGGVALGATVDYQILMAPSGDVNNLMEITCDSYSVNLAGGSFERVISGVNDTDVYYLRIYKMSGLGALLSGLLDGTTVTMSSVYNGTLTNNEVVANDVKIITKDNVLELQNINDSLNYSVFSLDGKLIKTQDSNTDLSEIDISFLKKGLYILNLQGSTTNMAYKFVKQ